MTSDTKVLSLLGL